MAIILIQRGNLSTTGGSTKLVPISVPETIGFNVFI